MASSAAQGGPHPLRPYYQPPEDKGNVFVASAQSPANETRRPRPASGGASPAHTNRYARAAEDDEHLAAAAQLGSLGELAKAGVLSLALQYSSTCIAMPFEVGKLLLQVQWVPKDDVWRSFVTAMAAESSSAASRRANTRGAANPTGSRLQRETSDIEEDEGEDEDEEMAPEAQEWRRAARPDEAASDEEEDEEEDLSSPSDVEAYFRDAPEASSRPRRPKKSRRDPATDSAGYLVRRSIAEGPESGSRPEFVMPVVVRGGVWEMMKAVARGKEGWAGLWKGTFTSFVYDLLASGLQPVTSAIICPLIPGSLSTLPLPYVPHPRRTLALLISSHIITHTILAPLDLIRTRLIVQSTLPRHRKYTGPWDALKKILAEEGGWRTVYGHPHLLVPALLDVSLRPLLSLSAPLILERVLHIEPTTSPVSYALAELILNTSTLLFSLPVETVRRRLQVQRRADWGKRVALEHGNRAQAPSKSHKSQRGTVPSSLLGSHSSLSASANTGTVRGLRTCVETRPKPYTGVIEAIYRILTEETAHLSSHAHHRHLRHLRHGHSSSSSTAGATDASEDSHPQPHDHRRQHFGGHQRTETEESSAMARSEIIAPQQPTYAYLGGLRSLYRGFTMAAGANLVVFLLTVVTGERVGANAAAGRAGGTLGGAGGWAEI
ncbi:unnamed protein product [Parajaminaea phylloscopi]